MPQTSPAEPPALSGKAMAAILALALAVPAAAALLPAAAPLRPDLVDPALLDRIQAGSPRIEAFVTYDHRATLDDAEALQGLGLSVLRLYPEFQLAFVVGSPIDLLQATALPGVLHLHGNEVLQYHLNSATVSTRAREVWDTKSTSTTPIVDANGDPITGRGVGVAVVDSGIDAVHPDLAKAVSHNLKYVCTTPGLGNTITGTCFGNALLTDIGCLDQFPGWVPLPITEVTSGHGTHVASIVAGRGVASDGRHTGAAPGAHLVGLGVGEVISVFYAVEAFNWVLCNADAHGIRVVTNSWGVDGPYVAADPLNVAVDALVAAGITVVFSAGNDGQVVPNPGINTYAKNPTPGVIGVASVWDNDAGSRATAALSAFSSFGPAAGPATQCPDISAPGEFITAAQALSGPLVSALGAVDILFGAPIGYLPYYSTIDGTSMAAPHVAGIIALLLEDNPTLTPAAIEATLEASALPLPGFAPIGPGLPNCQVGFGLVDAVAALGGGGSPLPQVSQNPHVYLAGLVDPMVVAGAPGIRQTQWTAVHNVPVDLAERFLLSGGPAWPLATGQPCQVQIFDPAAAPLGPPPGALVATLPCALAPDTVAGTFQLSVTHTFAAFVPAGLLHTYIVEPQVSWDGGATYVAIDSFNVRVVP